MSIEKQSNNQKGGKRAGAGRKKGEPNKRTVEAQDAAKASGIMPLEYLLSVMRSEDATMGMRMTAAQAAAPYVHAKLSSIELAAPGGAPLLTGITIKLVKPSGD